jgi:hypothetical protein
MKEPEELQELAQSWDSLNQRVCHSVVKKVIKKSRKLFSAWSRISKVHGTTVEGITLNKKLQQQLSKSLFLAKHRDFGFRVLKFYFDKVDQKYLNTAISSLGELEDSRLFTDSTASIKEFLSGSLKENFPNDSLLDLFMQLYTAKDSALLEERIKFLQSTNNEFIDLEAEALKQLPAALQETGSKIQAVFENMSLLREEDLEALMKNVEEGMSRYQKGKIFLEELSQQLKIPMPQFESSEHLTGWLSEQVPKYHKLLSPPEISFIKEFVEGNFTFSYQGKISILCKTFTSLQAASREELSKDMDEEFVQKLTLNSTSPGDWHSVIKELSEEDYESILTSLKNDLPQLRDLVEFLRESQLSEVSIQTLESDTKEVTQEKKSVSTDTAKKTQPSKSQGNEDAPPVSTARLQHPGADKASDEKEDKSSSNQNELTSQPVGTPKESVTIGEKAPSKTQDFESKKESRTKKQGKSSAPVHKIQEQSASIQEQHSLPFDQLPEPEKNPAKDTQLWAKIGWKFITQGEFFLATGCQSKMVEPSAYTLPPRWLLQVLEISPLISPGSLAFRNTISDLLQSEASDLQMIEGHPLAESLSHLYLSACLKPALYFRNHVAILQLEHASKYTKLSTLRRFTSAISAFLGEGIPLDLNCLSNLHSGKEKVQHKEIARKSVVLKIEEAFQFSFSNPILKRVWHSFLTDSNQIKAGTIQDLIGWADSDDTKDRTRAVNRLETLRNYEWIRGRVIELDKYSKHHRGTLRESELQQFHKRLLPILDCIEQYINVRSSLEHSNADFINQVHSVLLKKVLPLKSALMEEVQSCYETCESSIESATAQALRNVVTEIYQLFESGTVEPEKKTESAFAEIDINRLENLRRCAFHRLGIEGEEDLDSALPIILDGFLKRSQPSTLSGYFYCTRVGNFSGARELMNFPHFEKECREARITLDEIERDLEDRKTRLSDSLHQRIINIATEIDQASLLFDDSLHQREAAREELESIRQTASTEENLNILHKRLDHLSNTLSNIQQTAKDAFLGELKKHVDAGSSNYKRVRSLIHQRNFFLVHEYLLELKEGRNLPEERGGISLFQRLVSEIYEPLFEHLKDPKSRNQILQSLESARRTKRSNIGPLSLNHVIGKQIDPAISAQKIWNRAKSEIDISKEQVCDLLRYLGWKPSASSSTERTYERGKKEFVIQGETLKDRLVCPVAAYGSMANGKYHIHCVWENQTSEQVILQAKGQSDYVIMLYFGRISSQKRKYIHHNCWNKRKRILLVDEVTFTFMHSIREPKLPVLMQVCAPFTHIEPYEVSAGILSPEMFFGRREEIEKIRSERGSCFIYGGRQLGKTALLRHVARDTHDPANGKISIYIDLKAKGVGLGKSPDELWDELWQQFSNISNDPISLKKIKSRSADRFVEKLEQWANSDPGNRILLLLDEADRFLEGDGKNDFEVTEKLKGLMEITNRHFKVVLAGLHNVQRSMNMPNQPLAHFGSPICIGPLSGSELSEAQKLAERPLSFQGFLFENPDLVVRIIAQCNFYPSLIQIYGEKLLKHLKTKHLNQAKGSLLDAPFIIREDDLDQVEESNDLVEAVKARFALTLDLDARYRVIALVIANQFYATRDVEGVSQGFPVGLIRDQALSFWGKGFYESSSENMFSMLLDEMIGLGILRRTGEGNYALRSPGLLRLLGNRDKVESELLNFEDEPLPNEYDPATFHTSISPGAPDFRYHPLTKSQEGKILRKESLPIVIVGNELSSIETFCESMRNTSCRVIEQDPNVTSFQGFTNQLQKLKKSHNLEKPTLVYIHKDISWDENWLFESLRILKSGQTPGGYKPVFECSPQKLWDLMKREPEIMDDQSIIFLSSVPWHRQAIENLLDDSHVKSSGRQVDLLYDSTGGWPLLMYELLKFVGSDQHQFETKVGEYTKSLKGSTDSLWIRLCIPPDPILTSTLKVLAALDEAMSAMDIFEFMETKPELNLIQAALRWSEFCGILQRSTEGKYLLGPLIKTVLLPEGTSDENLVENARSFQVS